MLLFSQSSLFSDVCSKCSTAQTWWAWRKRMKTGENNRKPWPDSAACLLTSVHVDSQLSKEESSQVVVILTNFSLCICTSTHWTLWRKLQLPNFPQLLSFVFATNEMSRFYHYVYWLGVWSPFCTQTPTPTPPRSMQDFAIMTSKPLVSAAQLPKCSEWRLAAVGFLSSLILNTKLAAKALSCVTVFFDPSDSPDLWLKKWSNLHLSWVLQLLFGFIKQD